MYGGDLVLEEPSILSCCTGVRSRQVSAPPKPGPPAPPLFMTAPHSPNEFTFVRVSFYNLQQRT